MLTNLIDNAIRYTAPSGRVHVSVQPGDVTAQVIVQDTGPGIPADERERVFDRFYRGRDAAAGGSGLGLAIVRQIATLHAGSVTLSAANAGSGTQALATFPRRTTAVKVGVSGVLSCP